MAIRYVDKPAPSIRRFETAENNQRPEKSKKTWRRGRRIAAEQHLVIEKQKPWEAEGMSRATWYRRKAKRGEPR